MLQSRRSVLRSLTRWAATALLLPGLLFGASLRRYPTLHSVQTDRCTIIWATFEQGQAEALIATNAAMTSAQRVRATTTVFPPAQTGFSFTFYQHRAEFTGLRPATRYFYRVLVDSQVPTGDPPLGELSFVTAPVSGPFRFLALGDSGAGTFEQAEVAARMRSEPASLVLHTGDVVYLTGTHATYQNYYFDVYREMMSRIPFFTCPGNHDLVGDGGASYIALQEFPPSGVPVEDRGHYYSLDWSDVHFISLDSVLLLDSAGAARMLDWLEQDLRRTRKTWKIAYWHHPPYDSMRGVESEATAARHRLVPLMERYGVQLVLNGHHHAYVRTAPILGGEATTIEKGVTYITTGGGGAGLYPAERQHPAVYSESVHHYVRVDYRPGGLSIRAIRANGAQMDEAAIAPVPVITPDGVVSGASFTPALASGAIISLFGRYLAFEEQSAPGYPLPTELGSAHISIGGQRLPLFYASPSQINAQLPFDVKGEVTLRVSTDNGSTEISVQVSDAAPGIVYYGNLPAILKQDGSLVSQTNPARVGEYITIYATGLGPVSGRIQPGEPAPASPLMPVVNPLDIQIGGIRVVPDFAGLTPGYAGLYQVNLRVPTTVPSGMRVLSLASPGGRSASVAMAVE